MTRTERSDVVTRVEPAGPRAEVIASTLEALQARVEDADRQALRGAIAYHAPLAPGRGGDPAPTR
jgi:hypothetical protein